MNLEDDPLAWATAHLPTMTDAEANRAVGRLVAAGTPPLLLLPLLPKIGNALRTGATKAVDDPSERVALMSYRDEPDPLMRSLPTSQGWSRITTNGRSPGWTPTSACKRCNPSWPASPVRRR